jgi:ISXO2-like transposase domain
MHKSVDERRITGGGQSFRDKTIVMGILERGRRVKTQIIPVRLKNTLQPVVREHVETGAVLYTDEMGGYKGVREDYVYQIIDHAVEYVNGRVHTNGTENF